VVDRVIFDELVFGKINPSSRQKYLEIIQEFAVQGTQGVILGCTEIGLLLKQSDSELLLFDTTELHAEAALDFALE
jgi:aspartate racemase